MDIKLKNKSFYIAGLIISFYLLTLTLLTFIDVVTHYDFILRNPYFNSQDFKSDLVLYTESLIRTYNKDLENPSDNIKDYGTVENHYVSGNFVKYYLKNSENQVFTNIKDLESIDSYIKDSLYSVQLPKKFFDDDQLNEISNYFIWNNLEGYLIVPNVTDGYGQLFTDYTYYKSIRERVLGEILLTMISLAVAIALLMQIKKKPIDIKIINKLLTVNRRIPIEIRLILFSFCVLIIMLTVLKISFFHLPIRISHFIILSFIAVQLIYIMMNIREMIILINNKEERKKQWESSILYRFNMLLKAVFLNPGVLFKVLLILVLTVMLGGFVSLGLFGFLRRDFALIVFALFAICLYAITVFLYVLIKVGLFNHILKGTEAISSGDLDYVIDVKGSGNLMKLIRYINNMKSGFKESLENQMKSERMKSELITNVSHDLKTPLTSIINYVDLLKNRNLSPEEMQDYITILERKSQRLKTLIDDLFEASKMASGAVQLDTEKVDVVSLLNQALAEYHEEIDKSSLTFKLYIDKQKIYAHLDGKKTWRLFENLISNVLKYTLPHTRVYLSLTEEDNKVIFVIKNISAYELDFDLNELFERFKRGDKSRNIEGSGLGLAIAKSIAELQGGTLHIETDGDLFKAIVTFYN